MKALAKKWMDTSLILRIVCGLIIGTVLALVAPGVGVISLLGTLFVGALKAVAPILVFFLVMGALSRKAAGGGMKTVLIFYVAATIIASLVAVAASFIFPITVTLTDAVVQDSPAGVGEVLTNLLTNAVANPVDALANANYLGILAWACILGVALRFAGEGTKSILDDIAGAVRTAVLWIIQLAPFGILGLVYSSVSSSGLAIFTEYGMLLAVLVGCMLFIALITNPLLAWAAFRKNPYPLVLRTLKDSALTAFFTRSSAANIPVNMTLCEKPGLDKDLYSVSIPLGATINMGGAAVTISVMAMAAAHTVGVSVDLPTAVILCVLAAVSACGASGVAGGSLLLIPIACSLLGIGNDIAMQMVGIGFIVGVIQDSCETALNSSSDVLFTASTEYRAMRKAGLDFKPGKDVRAPEAEDAAA